MADANVGKETSIYSKSGLLAKKEIVRRSDAVQSYRKKETIHYKFELFTISLSNPSTISLSFSLSEVG